MKMFKKFSVVALAVVFMLSISGPMIAKAATTTVDLKTAAPFAILAGTPLISDAGGTSVITGNVGLSPRTGASIGLLSSQVTGTIYAVDGAGPSGAVNDPALLTIAKNDLTTAYTDAANRTPVTIVPSELGGQHLYSGVYASSDTKFGITAGAGPLVLDAQNNASAVFIFEGSFDATPALTVGPGSTVSLINGASACNVFWRVVAATIDTTAVFKGNILASTSITVANGANIEGRLLAQTGQVTLINDTIAVPICTVATVTATATSTATSGGVSISSVSSSAVAGAGLPSTGVGDSSTNTALWYVVILNSILILSTMLYLARKKPAKSA